MSYENKPSFKLAQHNLNLAEGLIKNNKYHDWTVTILYYSALMFARTLYEVRSWALPTTHSTKGNQIGWNQSIGDNIGKQAKYNFDTLFRASWKYRYNPNEALLVNEPAIRKYKQFYGDFVGKVFEELKK